MLIMSREKREGGSEARQRQRQNKKKESALALTIQLNSQLTLHLCIL